MSLIATSVIGATAAGAVVGAAPVAAPVAAAAAPQVSNAVILGRAAKQVFMSAPLSSFVKAGLFVGVTVASAYVLISRFKKIRKLKKEAEEEMDRTGSPLLFEHEDITPAERALGLDNIVDDQDRMDELDAAMDALRHTSRMCGSERRGRMAPPRREEKPKGKKKKNGAKKKKAKRNTSRILDDYRPMSEVRAAGREELRRWFELFNSFDLNQVDAAARDLGLGHDDDD